MEINIEDLTTMDLQGDGAFDNIMTAMQTRLDREFKKNRLKGPDYAKVYLGSYEASLMNTVQFLLGRQEASAKADLIKEQIKTEVEQRKLVQAQISKMAAEERLIEGQIDKMEQEILVMKGEVSMIPHKIDLLKAQVIKMQKEGELIDGQIKKMTQEILLMTRQAEKMLSEIELMKKQVIKMDDEILLMKSQVRKSDKEIDLITSQIDKMKYEIDVMEQQVLESIQKVETMKASVWAERAKTESTCKVFNEPYIPSCANEDDEVTGLVGNQIKKTNAEVTLLAQKGYTEEAQTRDLVGKAPDEYDVVGVIGKQKNLYQRQADGFLRDAEQKMAKIMTDTWNTQMVSQDGIEASPAGLGYSDVCAVVNKARTGIEAGTSGNCAGGGNDGEIEGVTVDITAITNVLEDCLTTFESHITLDNLPGVSIRSWAWSTTEGRDTQGNIYKGPWNKQCLSEGAAAANGQACNSNGYGAHYLFETAFWEPGDNPVTLKITLEDTDTTSEYHNHVITVTKQFNATETADGGCMQDGPRPSNAATIEEDKKAAAYSAAHPKDYDLTGAWVQGPEGFTVSTEGHKGQAPKTVLP